MKTLLERLQFVEGHFFRKSEAYEEQAEEAARLLAVSRSNAVDYIRKHRAICRLVDRLEEDSISEDRAETLLDKICNARLK